MDRIQKGQVQVPGNGRIEPGMCWEGIIGIVPTSYKALSMQKEPILTDMIPENLCFDARGCPGF